MGGKLEKLWELQNLDSRIDNIKKEIEKNQKIIENARLELARTKETFNLKKEELKKKRLKLKELENDLKEYEEKIKKLVAQLYATKTNQEYSTLDAQIKNLKADRNLKEDEVLNFAIQLDEGDEELNLERKEIEKKEFLLAEQEKQIKAIIEQYREEISNLEKLKSALREQIDAHLLSNYDKIMLKKSDRKALAYIKPLDEARKTPEESPNTWACSECNVTITIQELNTILLNKEIVLCRSCSRILDIKEPIQYTSSGGEKQE
ncbi:MAG: zinc ribbon domain-containing protein [Planctomycetota bacterium]